LAQVSQQSSPLANKLQQPAPGTFIVAVDAQMSGELVDTGGQDGNLYFR